MKFFKKNTELKSVKLPIFRIVISILLLVLAYNRNRIFPTDNENLIQFGTLITLLLIGVCFYLISISISELSEVKRSDKSGSYPSFEKREWTIERLLSFIEESDMIDIVIDQSGTPLRISVKSDYRRRDKYSKSELFDKAYYIEDVEYKNYNDFKEELQKTIQSDVVTLLYVGIEDMPLDNFESKTSMKKRNIGDYEIVTTEDRVKIWHPHSEEDNDTKFKILLFLGWALINVLPSLLFYFTKNYYHIIIWLVVMGAGGLYLCIGFSKRDKMKYFSVELDAEGVHEIWTTPGHESKKTLLWSEMKKYQIFYTVYGSLRTYRYDAIMFSTEEREDAKWRRIIRRKMGSSMQYETKFKAMPNTIVIVTGHAYGERLMIYLAEEMLARDWIPE